MAIKIGITGGIGSGKSVVCRLLEVMGVPVYISDVETRRLMVSDPSIRQELIALLGGDVYLGKALNKPLLAAYLFSDSEHARQVNAIVHPRVKADFRQWVKRHEASSWVAIESAILIEAGFSAEVDVIAMVYASQELRIRRAVQRDTSSPEVVRQRIERQMDDEVKRAAADFVIVNDGETPLIPQVLELITSLSKNIAYLCPPKN